MIAVVSDNSNQNGGAAMRVGGAEMIASHLISKLLLVSDLILFFCVRSWRTCVVLVCVTSLVWTFRIVVLLCVPSLV